MCFVHAYIDDFAQWKVGETGSLFHRWIMIKSRMKLGLSLEVRSIISGGFRQTAINYYPQHDHKVGLIFW